MFSSVRGPKPPQSALLSEIYKLALSPAARILSLCISIAPSASLLVVFGIAKAYTFAVEPSVLADSCISACALPMVALAAALGLVAVNQDESGPRQLAMRLISRSFIRTYFTKVWATVIGLLLSLAIQLLGVALTTSYIAGSFAPSPLWQLLCIDTAVLVFAILGCSIAALAQNPAKASAYTVLFVATLPPLLTTLNQPFSTWLVSMSPLSLVQNISNSPKGPAFVVPGVPLSTFGVTMATALIALWGCLSLTVTASLGRWHEDKILRLRIFSKPNRAAWNNGSTRPSLILAQIYRLSVSPRLRGFALAAVGVAVAITGRAGLAGNSAFFADDTGQVLREDLLAYQNGVLSSASGALVFMFLVIGVLASGSDDSKSVSDFEVLFSSTRSKVFVSRLGAAFAASAILSLCTSLAIWLSGTSSLKASGLQVDPFSSPACFTTFTEWCIFTASALVGFGLSIVFRSVQTSILVTSILWILVPTILGALGPVLGSNGLAWIYNLINLVPSAPASLHWVKPNESLFGTFNQGEIALYPEEAAAVFYCWALVTVWLGWLRFTLRKN